jgi:hypothetical protein
LFVANSLVAAVGHIPSLWCSSFFFQVAVSGDESVVAEKTVDSSELIKKAYQEQCFVRVLYSELKQRMCVMLLCSIVGARDLLRECKTKARTKAD